LRIPQDVIDRIKQEARISDVIGEYIPLKKTGSSYKGLCPFHNDKNPSLSVTNELKMYQCFSCGASGDVFKFLMDFKNISYPEAVREVAEKYGIKIQSTSDKNYSKNAEKQSISLEILNLAGKIYYRKLSNNSPAYKYLISRGLDDHDIHKFKLGYSPDSWNFIYNYLKSKNYKIESIKNAGLIKKSEKTNNYYDSFRNRVMFPIFNERENVIAFGSRVLDDSLPKYINSKDSEVFNKKKVLYGINLAQKHFRQKGYAIITEGYFDVIACHKFGFDTAVATLGTAVSKYHFSYLSRQRIKEIYLVFDPDEAGIKACFRAISIASEYDFIIKVISLEDGLDPMDFLMKYGRNSFINKMKQSKSPIDFVLDSSKQEFELNKPEAKLGFIKNIFSFVRGIKNELLKDEFLKRLSEITDMNEQAIRDEYVKADKAPIRVFKKQDKLGEESKRERNLLFLLFANPHLFKLYYDKIHYDFFQDNFCRKVYKAGVEKYKEIKKYDVSEVINAIEHVFDKEEDKEYFSNELFKDIYLNKPDIQVEVILKEIRMYKIDARMKEESRIIKELEQSGDEKNSLQLLEELDHIFREKNKLKRTIQSVEKT
jgi:DNA primase